MTDSAFQVKKYTLGPLETGAYLIIDRHKKEAAMIDPGAFDSDIIDTIQSQDVQLKKILLTHGHYDHIAGVPELAEKTGAEIVIHEKDHPMLSDPHLNLSAFFGLLFTVDADVHNYTEGGIVQVGDFRLKVIETPGHTPGSICLLADDILFSGDTLFRNSVGRSDFPGSSTKDLRHSLHEILMKLDDSVRVMSGHGDQTTIGHERRINPFIQNG